MKQLIKLMMIAAMLLTATCTLAAPTQKSTQRVTREQLAERQARHIAEQLALSTELTDRFVAVYVKCQNEIWALNKPEVKGNEKKNLSEEQTDSIIRARFDRSQKTLDIRKKYYNEYRKFLTAKQIERVYTMEGNMMKRLKESRNANNKNKQHNNANRPKHNRNK